MKQEVGENCMKRSFVICSLEEISLSSLYHGAEDRKDV
jgi:hypothetical protein